MSKYYIDGKETDLPLAGYRYISKEEFKRAISLVTEYLKLALERAPVLQQIIRDFDGRPAKAKFEKRLEEHGFSFENGNVYMILPSNCVLSDDGKELIAWNNLPATRFNLEKGICICSFIKFDEEGMIDAERTLADSSEEDTIVTDIRIIERELEDLTCPDADKWIEKLFEARELLREIHRDAPDELKYRLFGDAMHDAGTCE